VERCSAHRRVLHMAQHRFSPGFSPGLLRILSWASSRGVPRLGVALALATSCLCWPALPARAQDAYSKLEAQYQSENDPVRKAKIVAKLGHFEIDQSRSDLKAGDEEKALAVLERYNDEVRKTGEALTASGIDPERRPAGFKELQISLREFIRQLDDLILTLPFDKRPWFQAVRSDISATQNSLFDALFPSGNGKGSKHNRSVK
jgi:hypothetical protein